MDRRRIVKNLKSWYNIYVNKGEFFMSKMDYLDSMNSCGSSTGAFKSVDIF